MDTRIAVISIIVENLDNSEKVNALLHENAQYLVGRMGIPYRKRKLSIISVIIDAPLNTINTLTGKLGMIEGVNVKTVYTKE